MKKNTLHKVMATALVGAMAMSTLTGCGSSADNTTADAGTKESVAESSAASTDAGASTAVAGIDGWEAFADNVTLQIPVYDRGSSGNGCSDVENNYWTNWVQENFGDKYNITVEYVGITRSDVMTDYAMLAASQSLPTICMEYDYDKLLDSFKKRLDAKYENLKNGHWYAGTFSEFGLRRRLSAEAQELAVQKFAHLNDTLHSSSKFVGTSNVYLAKKYGLTPVGTMAHEWIMCTGQGNHRHNPAYSNWYALDAWIKEYGVLNGIALTDTITTDCFLRDFQLTYATLFSGVRHDSGDPYEWGEKMIAHYKSLGIDPKTKTLLFSDSLDFERADKLYRHFCKETNVAFGIGTYLSNDTDVPALNIVMKTTICNGMDVAKISDTPGKGMCKNPDYVDYLNRCIDYRMKNDR